MPRVFGDHSRSSCSAACRALPKKVGETLVERVEERNRKVREEQGHDMDHKRRKLDDIEDAVMKEDDPEQLATLYEQFRKEYEEYLMEKAEKEGSDVKRRKLRVRRWNRVPQRGIAHRARRIR